RLRAGALPRSFVAPLALLTVAFALAFAALLTVFAAGRVVGMRGGRLNHRLEPTRQEIDDGQSADPRPVEGPDAHDGGDLVAQLDRGHRLAVGGLVGAEDLEEARARFVRHAGVE